MKKVLTFILLIAFTAPLLPTISPLTAAPYRVEATTKDAYKAVFNLVTYDAEGNRLLSGYGAFIAEDGTGIAAYSLLKEAARAEVIDVKGKHYPVHRILGASAGYDLVKFSVEGVKKTAFLPLSTVAPVADSEVSLVRFTENKKNALLPARITKVEPYDRYTFLYTSVTNETTHIGLPLINAEGFLVGLIQAGTEEKTETAYAIDARFCADLIITEASVLSADLRALSLPKALPATQKEALTYIYMMSRADSMAYTTALSDFIQAFPDQAEGYVLRGSYYASRSDYARCNEDFATAAEKAKDEESLMKADEVSNELSKLIYQKAVYAPKPEVEGWTLERAATLAEQAYALQPRPNYLLQQGRSLFSLQEFGRAYATFRRLCETTRTDSVEQWSSTAQAEAWFFAARSLELSGGDSLEVIALLDSTIATLPTPYTVASMQYFLERAQRLERVGRYRDAVMDYNEYERNIGPKNLNAQFYYIREQAELRARMYQQALDDMRTAIVLSPNDPAYKIEEALILLRAGLFEEAAARCEALLKDFPSSSDCYKIAGIAYGELKQKAKAIAALNKAFELGDPSAKPFLEKYQ